MTQLCHKLLQRDVCFNCIDQIDFTNRKKSSLGVQRKKTQRKYNPFTIKQEKLFKHDLNLRSTMWWQVFVKRYLCANTDNTTRTTKIMPHHTIDTLHAKKTACINRKRVLFFHFNKDWWWKIRTLFSDKHFEYCLFTIYYLKVFSNVELVLIIKSFCLQSELKWMLFLLKSLKNVWLPSFSQEFRKKLDISIKILIQMDPPSANRWSPSAHCQYTHSGIRGLKTCTVIVTHSRTFLLSLCWHELQTACGVHTLRRSNVPIWWWERHEDKVNVKTQECCSKTLLTHIQCPWRWH